MSQAAVSTYDLVPYPNHPFLQSHPDRLATVAILLGMTPPPVDHCRVLELGCAAGGNLLPMAIALPESTFVGVELSGQIAEAQRDAQALDLKNVELRQMNIMDVSADLGSFDYIIVHGVFSWVPREVQDKILEICAQQLTPQGVAYVSYNTYPGWHMRQMIRDMMLYHGQRFVNPGDAVRQARGLLDFLAQSVSANKDNSAYSLLLKQEVETLRNHADAYLFHEHLEPCNEPIYFHHFVERARGKDLEFLGESHLNSMVPGNFGPEIEAGLQRLSQDIVQIEQFMDFVRNRTFRETLLCRKDIKPNYRISPKQMPTFLVASAMKPASPQPDERSTQTEAYQGPNNVTLSTGEPLVKAALGYLWQQFPLAIPFEKLRQAAHARLADTPPDDPAVSARESALLSQALLTAYTKVSSRALELHVHQPAFTLEVSAAPRACPLARHQAAKSPHVTNRRHEVVALADFDRYLLMRLDGTSSFEVLVDHIFGLVKAGTLLVQQEGKPMAHDGDESNLRQMVSNTLTGRLHWLARKALLLE